MWMGLAFMFSVRVLFASQEHDIRLTNGKELVECVHGKQEVPPTGTLRPHTIIAWKQQRNRCDGLHNRIHEPECETNRNDGVQSTIDYEGTMSNPIGETGSMNLSDIDDEELYPDELHFTTKTRFMNVISPKDLKSVVEHLLPRIKWKIASSKKEIKRGYFNPWGGKRVTIYGQNGNVRRPIRVPFNSWGGKRSQGTREPFAENGSNTRSSSGNGKPSSYHSWGGKQPSNDENNLIVDSTYKNIEKRTKFNPWGGKRSRAQDPEEEAMKRVRFNAWGGKRSGILEECVPVSINVKKNIFNGWGLYKGQKHQRGAPIGNSHPSIWR